MATRSLRAMRWRPRADGCRVSTTPGKPTTRTAQGKRSRTSRGPRLQDELHVGFVGVPAHCDGLAWVRPDRGGRSVQPVLDPRNGRRSSGPLAVRPQGCCEKAAPRGIAVPRASAHAHRHGRTRTASANARRHGRARTSSWRDCEKAPPRVGAVPRASANAHENGRARMSSWRD